MFRFPLFFQAFSSRMTEISDASPVAHYKKWEFSGFEQR